MHFATDCDTTSEEYYIHCLVSLGFYSLRLCPFRGAVAFTHCLLTLTALPLGRCRTLLCFLKSLN